MIAQISFHIYFRYILLSLFIFLLSGYLITSYSWYTFLFINTIYALAFSTLRHNEWLLKSFISLATATFSLCVTFVARSACSIYRHDYISSLDLIAHLFFIIAFHTYGFRLQAHARTIYFTAIFRFSTSILDYCRAAWWSTLYFLSLAIHFYFDILWFSFSHFHILLYKSISRATIFFSNSVNILIFKHNTHAPFHSCTLIIFRWWIIIDIFGPFQFIIITVFYITVPFISFDKFLSITRISFRHISLAAAFEHTLFNMHTY